MFNFQNTLFVILIQKINKLFSLLIKELRNSAAQLFSTIFLYTKALHGFSQQYFGKLKFTLGYNHFYFRKYVSRKVNVKRKKCWYSETFSERVWWRKIYGRAWEGQPEKPYLLEKVNIIKLGNFIVKNFRAPALPTIIFVCTFL